MINEIPLQMHMLRSFKGAPVSVLMALWLVATPQNVKWLQRQTGYRFEAIQEALDVLSDYQMVQRIDRYHWQIAGNTRQFPLGHMMIESVSSTPLDKLGERASSGNGEDEAVPDHNETTLPLFESVTDIKKDFGKTEVPAQGMVKDTGTSEKPKSDFGKTEVPFSSSSRSINLDSRKDLLLAREDFGKIEVIEILDRFGVREPKRSRIAKMPGIGAREALYHLTTAKTVALAIYRIENRWRVPDGWEPAESPLESPLPEGWQNGQNPPDDQVEVFERALECLRANIPNSVYSTWFVALRLSGVTPDLNQPGQAPLDPPGGGKKRIEIAAANSFVIDQVAAYAGELQQALCSEFGTPVEIEFIVR